MLKPITYFLLLACLLSSAALMAQSAEQRELEAKKNRLQQEIRQINNLLSKQRQQRKSVLEELEETNQRIGVRKELIQVTNRQANLLSRQIDKNLRQIGGLRQELKALKEDYAAMIRKSYKSKSQQSRLMFLLSSENFQQAYKRLKYMQQYANYRKKQGDLILEKASQLKELNQGLIQQRKAKEQVIAENRKEQRLLEDELSNQQQLMQSIKKQESVFAAQIRQKQKESDEIDREIERMVREAIAKANKAKGSTKKSGGFDLTAEAKLVDASFKANKGKLPWPVEKGVLKMRFGTQPHPAVPSVTINSNGVRIATEKGAKARSIFNGKVLAVQAIKGGNKAVLIQHGNYISVYNNLGKVFVKEGDMVTTKQDIGEIFTSSANNETLLKFMIYNNNQIDNPANWIYRM